MLDTDEKTITGNRAINAKFAAFDAKDKSVKALDKHMDFFSRPEHIATVEAVSKIVQDFFKIKKGFYVTPRGGKNSPMTVVKVEDPVFPNIMPQAERRERFYNPLEALGVEIVYSKGSNSYLFRVR